MKIAVVGHDSFWPVRGGGGIRMYWIVKKLVEAGHDITVIAPIGDIKGLDKEFPNVKIKSLGDFSRFDKNKEARYAKLAVKILITLLKTKVDVIYANSIVAAFPSHIASKIKRKPLVFDMIDILTGYSRKKIIRYFGKKLEVAIAKRATCLITMSESLKKELQRNNVTREIHTVFHGVDFTKFNPTTEKRINKIIYTGGIEQHDGLMLLLEIAPSLIEKYPDIQFEIIGEGSYLDKIVDKAIKLKLFEKHFSFISWVKNDELPSYLSTAKIGIIPNFNSPANEVCLPLKGFEYLAMGLPIVGSNFPGIKEEVGDDQRGLLFEPGNPRDFLQKISRLLDNNQLRSDLGRAGKNFVRKNCSWDANANKIVQIIENSVN